MLQLQQTIVVINVKLSNVKRACKLIFIYKVSYICLKERGNMKRTIIKIDEEKCNGCGLCASACHEGAIGMINGKAKLIRDDYCDGLGDCLPTCPTGAISFEVREAEPFNAAAVEAKKQREAKARVALPSSCSCPETAARTIEEKESEECVSCKPVSSRLRQWPIQLKLVPVEAPFFSNANLLIAADCAAFAYANFHEDFIKDRITVIGCPKLDAGSYAEKLTEILRRNSIKSVTIVRMEVPCCGGLEFAAKQALKDCGKMIPWQSVTISSDGRILE